MSAFHFEVKSIQLHLARVFVSFFFFLSFFVLFFFGGQ